nr:immunoglobulin heavy chain junction region [Mus musculus]
CARDYGSNYGYVMDYW